MSWPLILFVGILTSIPFHSHSLCSPCLRASMLIRFAPGQLQSRRSAQKYRTAWSSA
jgi:hypothetical protein